jgi:DNA-cytosine methyltransferase
MSGDRLNKDTDMRVSSFFAGIGGFDLGLEQAGINVVFQCELDPFCQQILKRHWPHVPIHDDITTLNPATIPAADLWCAGWPCQDLSTANTERTGLSGKRSGLFFTFMDLVREVRPAWLVMENVPGLLSAEQGTALETVAHGAKTGSQKAQEILSRWAEYLPKFWQLVPPSEAETPEASAKQAVSA